MPSTHDCLQTASFVGVRPRAASTSGRAGLEPAAGDSDTVEDFAQLPFAVTIVRQMGAGLVPTRPNSAAA